MIETTETIEYADQTYLAPDYVPDAYNQPPIPYAITGQSLPEASGYADATPYTSYSMDLATPPSPIIGESLTGSRWTFTGIGQTLLDHTVEARHRTPGSGEQPSGRHHIKETPEDGEPPHAEAGNGEPPVPPDDTHPSPYPGEPYDEGDNNDAEAARRAAKEITVELPTINTPASEQAAAAAGTRFKTMLSGRRRAAQRTATNAPDVSEETSAAADQSAPEFGSAGVQPLPGQILTSDAQADLAARRARGDRAPESLVPTEILERVKEGLNRIPEGASPPRGRHHIENVQVEVTDEEAAAAGGWLEALGDKLAGIEPGAVRPRPDEKSNPEEKEGNNNL